MARTWNILARHRRNPIAVAIMRAARSIVRGYHNIDYDAETNGEGFLIETIAALNPAPILFDVGAHVGDWSRLARARAPGATIHAFELMPGTADLFVARHGADAGIRLVRAGLDAAAGMVAVHDTGDNGPLARIAVDGLDDGPTTRLPVTTGDDYLAANGIARVDLLKIDVEGAELRVIAGFDAAIRAGKIRAIQFEYGRISAMTGATLAAIHAVLAPRGYLIGKLFPRDVDFQPAAFAREDFVGPNCVAARADDAELLARLGWRGAPDRWHAVT